MVSQNLAKQKNLNVLGTTHKCELNYLAFELLLKKIAVLLRCCIM